LINSIIFQRYDFKDIEINRLDNQILVRYFDEEWENYNISRRFCKTVGLALLAVPFLQGMSKKAIQVLIRLSGTNHILGHLRTKLSKPTKQIHIPFNCGGE
jgi:hypothetical protein